MYRRKYWNTYELKYCEWDLPEILKELITGINFLKIINTAAYRCQNNNRDKTLLKDTLLLSCWNQSFLYLIKDNYWDIVLHIIWKKNKIFPSWRQYILISSSHIKWVCRVSYTVLVTFAQTKVLEKGRKGEKLISFHHPYTPKKKKNVYWLLSLVYKSFQLLRSQFFPKSFIC